MLNEVGKEIAKQISFGGGPTQAIQNIGQAVVEPLKQGAQPILQQLSNFVVQLAQSIL